ncbi:ABC transporter ATP-binding protein [Sphingopyxis sp. DHUNG17]|uniref:ABC transporter ATP-binding protein n=1 Tax=Sphingopyxis jiangsuensis TaxID=2871171 RepID=UPI00191D1604|nr:ABC transporter ATP-binding protein [Sphingopyxis lutea]MBL0768200.1 ABC transporter ATP-binding protein [Sphingopyxis lutea]
MSDALHIKNLTVRAGAKTLLDDVTATIEPGRITAIVGPNGAGKSTLIRALAGVAPFAGTLALGATPLAHLSPTERARRIAYLPQHHDLAWNIKVRDMVALGRFAYGAEPGKLGATDRAAVERAMEAACCAALADRGVADLSGGEQALACLARVLAADTPVLLADEPAAALDPANQYRAMECLAEKSAHGCTVLVVLHDLTLVAQFSHSVLWLQGGRLVAHERADCESLAHHIPTLFGRTPSFATDGSEALFFVRDPNES